MNLVRTLLLGLGVALMLGSTSEGAELKKGDKAPDFELKGSDGKSYKLADFKDKQAVIVAWFPKAFTGGWTAECKSLRESGKALREYNVAYFTASCDPVEKNTAFAKSLELDYPILSDPEGKTADDYGIYNKEKKFSSRVTFIIGKDGKIAHVESKVQSGSHAEQLLALLKELNIEKAPKKE